MGDSKEKIVTGAIWAVPLVLLGSDKTLNEYFQTYRMESRCYKEEKLEHTFLFFQYVPVSLFFFK